MSMTKDKRFTDDFKEEKFSQAGTPWIQGKQKCTEKYKLWNCVS